MADNIINIYHIIEQAGVCGQQTVEAHKATLEEALETYIEFSTTEACSAIIREDGRTTYIFPSEKLEVTHVDEFRVFAKWTHFKGLY